MMSADIPAITSQQAEAMVNPAKRYFNQSTNRYYTDPTGQWTPPAGWAQTTFKDGGDVNTKHFETGGYADYDLGIDPYTYADYGLGIDPGSMNTDYSNIFDFDTGIGDTAAGNFNYEEDTLSPEQRDQLNDVRWESGYFGSDEDVAKNYGNEGRAYSGKNAIDPITGSPVNAKVGSPNRSLNSNPLKSLADAAKNNPNLTKALMAAGLGGLLGYLGRPKGFNPKGMQGGSLGLSQSQVHGALKGVPVKRAEGGEIDGYAGGGGLHYLKSAEDGMADRIPATIDNKQPAKLSGGEFVIPADVVSHLGNGNSEAGAKQLYAMMDRIRHARTGNKKQGKQINPAKFTPK
jgi:hypothetical protein